MHTRAGTRMRSSARLERTAGRRALRPTLVAIAVALGLGVGGIAHAGVGISPVIIEFDDALRGGTYQRTLRLSNTDPELPSTFTVEATGEIAGWVTVHEPDGPPATEFEVSPDSRLGLVVQLVVPDDAANADYEGALEVLGSVADGTDGAGVQLGGLVNIDVTVTGTERRDGAVVDYQIGRAEVGTDQRFTAVIENRGNVQILPEMEVVVTRDGRPVETLSTAGEAWVVQADTSGSVTVTWTTSEVAAGDYTAAFRVVDIAGNRPVLLGEREVPFRLEPRGTFTRSGTLTDLRLLTAATIDAPIIVEATFANNGRIDTVAILEGRLRRDGELVDVAQSLERTVLEGRSEPLTVTFTIEEAGTYHVEGVVNYDGFLTEPLELRFAVDSAGTVTASDGSADSDDSGGNGPTLVVGGMAALGAIAVTAGWLLGRRRRDDDSAVPSSDHPAGPSDAPHGDPVLMIDRVAVGSTVSDDREG